VSQSPLSQVKSDEALLYRQGWRALNRLLHENRSFSGNERHCAFVNCGPDANGRHQAFANVSNAIGFDFSDDGRGLAVADWDFDGDLDVWTTSRTAPRVRFLRNSNANRNHFVSIQLRGNGSSTNRDAIGARVAVHLADRDQPLIKTLHAGHGFLSQSTRWLHFGLGTSSTIDRIVIKWPAGGRQELAGLKAGQHYIITQDSPRAVPFSPPVKRAALTASRPDLPSGSPSARIIVPPGMPLPKLVTTDRAGREQPFRRRKQGLLLVNLWSAWCLPCQEELSEWAQAAADFRKARIEVVALHAESGRNRKEELMKAREAIAESRFPFPWLTAAPLTTRSLNFLHAACLDLWAPLPVPSSVLVDARGEVLALYVGPVEASQILRDAKLATATPEDRRNAAIPFPGRWVGPPAATEPTRIAMQMVDGNEAGLAIDYLFQLINTSAPLADTPQEQRSLGDQRFMLGLLLEEQLRLSAAGSQLAAARQLIPTDVRIQKALQRIVARMRDPDRTTALFKAALEAEPGNLFQRQELGLLQLNWDRPDAAAEQLAMVIEKQPQNAIARYHLANALLETGSPGEAVEHLKRTLSTNPRILDAANLLASVLATHPTPSVRAPEESLVLATRLCTVTKNQNPRYLETLACAQAANGDFTKALATGRQALTGYQAHPASKAAAEALSRRLKLFASQKPFIADHWPTP